MKMYERKIMPIAIAIVLLAMMTLTLVIAAPTLTVPVTGTNYTTTMTWSCTSDINTSAVTDYNVSILYNSTGGSAVDGTLLVTVQNSSANSVFSAATSITSLSDLLTYNFTCLGDNVTDQVYSVSVASVGIDNTVPAISVTTDISSISYNRFLKYTTTMSDATSGLDGTEDCNITNPQGADVGVINDSETNAIFDETNLQGDYNLSCKATDNAGNVFDASTIFTVDSAGAITGGAAAGTGTSTGVFSVIDDLQEKIQGIDQQTMIIIIIIIVVIAIGMKKK